MPTGRPRVARWGWLAAGGVVAGLLVTFGVWSRSLGRWERLRARAGAAIHADDAARAWNAYNAGPHADADSRIAEARAWLAAGFAARAVTVLDEVAARTPGIAEPWLLRLEVLRVEDRPAEARRLGFDALAVLDDPGARLAVLRSMTLALLADVPDDLARETLTRWVKADPGDLDARASWLRRIAAGPGPATPTAPPASPPCLTCWRPTRTTPGCARP